MAISTAAPSTTGTRVLAMGRAELILLGRNKMALYVALLLPVLMVWMMRRTIGEMDFGDSGMSLNEASLTGAFGFILLFVVYQNLVSAYVARREELVLKRLRTGEASDIEILGGTALPAVAIAVAQMVVLLVAGVCWLDLRAPARIDLMLIGLVFGLVLSIALAALTTAWAKTVESAQLVTTPLLLISLMGSGLIVPLETMPDVLGDVCGLLPLSPVVELVRGGWLGGLSAYKAVGHVATAVAWTVLAVFAVRRWFRWEPRR